MGRRLALGRGMKSLIPDIAEDDKHKVLNIDMDLIKPNPHQPRKTFETEKLKELADSIRENGIIQPIVVTKDKKGYLLIAGERRWRASQLAGYEKIPAVIKNASEEEAMSWALIENIQRQNLNPIEEAMAYKNLMEQQDMTQEKMAKKLGKGRANIANTLRLLRLPSDIQSMIQQRKISFGHAKALITVDSARVAISLAREVEAKGLSVRALEKKVQMFKEQSKKKKEPRKKDPFFKRAEKRMSQFVGLKVVIQGNQKKGKIAIPYGSEEELQRIYECLTGEEVTK
ncbi:MAG: hypothetical protein CR997_11815 [Acidobacteria bacterium]|nr:MAG: hypothetical protein CR997_11815 [Acidobacteriota bacterium]